MSQSVPPDPQTQSRLTSMFGASQTATSVFAVLSQSVPPDLITSYVNVWRQSNGHKRLYSLESICTPRPPHVITSHVNVGHQSNGHKRLYSLESICTPRRNNVLRQCWASVKRPQASLQSRVNLYPRRNHAVRQCLASVKRLTVLSQSVPPDGKNRLTVLSQSVPPDGHKRLTVLSQSVPPDGHKRLYSLESICTPRRHRAVSAEDHGHSGDGHAGALPHGDAAHPLQPQRRRWHERDHHHPVDRRGVGGRC